SLKFEYHRINLCFWQADVFIGVANGGISAYHRLWYNQFSRGIYSLSDTVLQPDPSQRRHRVAKSFERDLSGFIQARCASSM
ncbi:MAG: hypothetical protein M1335_02380, partial [Chloroflexi bacterium]|nr:hypothetical protein [Chloroflexota bacterium]